MMTVGVTLLQMTAVVSIAQYGPDHVADKDKGPCVLSYDCDGNDMAMA